MAFMGPDTPPLGEREMARPVTQSQSAATLATLCGYYDAAAPKAGSPTMNVPGLQNRLAAKLEPSELRRATPRLWAAARIEPRHFTARFARGAAQEQALPMPPKVSII